jgi:acetyltransferase
MSNTMHDMTTREVRAARAKFPPLRRRLLPDGRRTVVRALRPDDAPRYADFVRGLSPETLYNRLLGAGVAVTAERLQRLLVVDQQKHVAVAAIMRLDDGAEQIVGVARFVIEADGAAAEFAVTVADEWQHKGLGTVLLRTLMLEARRAGVARLIGEVFRSNTPMLALLRKTGFDLATTEGDAHLPSASRHLSPSRQPSPSRARRAPRTAPRRAPGRRPLRP